MKEQNNSSNEMISSRLSSNKFLNATFASPPHKLRVIYSGAVYCAYPSAGII